MDQSLILVLQCLGQLLQANVGEAILTKIKLRKSSIVFDDLTDDVQGLVPERHVREVQLSRADFMVLEDQVEEAEHLLLAGVDDQVLTLGNVELEQELLLDAFDLRHVLHLVAELADVDFLDRNGHDGASDRVVCVRVGRCFTLATPRLL